MLVALGAIVPIAVAMSLSSIPIMVTIVVLLSPSPRRRAMAFLIAWVVGMAGVLYACILLAGALPETNTAKQPQPVVGVAIIAVGVALLLLGVLGARRPRTTSGMPSWLTAVGSVGWAKAAGLALVLNLRPKALLLAFAAGLSLRGTELTPGQTGIVVTIYTVIAVSSVAGPIAYSLAAPVRSQAWLVIARKWVEKNSAVVTLVILLLVGVVVLGEGISRL